MRKKKAPKAQEEVHTSVQWAMSPLKPVEKSYTVHYIWAIVALVAMALTYNLILRCLA